MCLARRRGVVERRRRELSVCLISAPVADLGRGREPARAAQRWRAQRQRGAEHFLAADSSALWVSRFFVSASRDSCSGGVCLATEQVFGLPKCLADCPNRSTESMAAPRKMASVRRGTSETAASWVFLRLFIASGLVEPARRRNTRLHRLLRPRAQAAPAADDKSHRARLRTQRNNHGLRLLRRSDADLALPRQ